MQGYQIPFWREPKQKTVPNNNRLYYSEIAIYTAAINQLLEIGGISETSHIQGEFISSYFCITTTFQIGGLSFGFKSYS